MPLPTRTTCIETISATTQTPVNSFYSQPILKISTVSTTGTTLSAAVKPTPSISVTPSPIKETINPAPFQRFHLKSKSVSPETRKISKRAGRLSHPDIVPLVHMQG